MPQDKRMTDRTHQEPVWRAKSDFIIGIAIDPVDTEFASEQLWAKRHSDDLFELCCIPFFTYDLALGDIVRTDSGYNVVELVLRSGHHTFRLDLRGVSEQRRSAITGQLTEMGALLEWSSQNFLAVDADPANGQEVNDYLERQYLEGLNFERGWLTEFSTSKLPLEIKVR